MPCQLFVCPVDAALVHRPRYFTEGADEVAFLNITGFRDCPLEDLPMLGVSGSSSSGKSAAAI